MVLFVVFGREHTSYLLLDVVSGYNISSLTVLVPGCNRSREIYTLDNRENSGLLANFFFFPLLKTTVVLFEVLLVSMM